MMRRTPFSNPPHATHGKVSAAPTTFTARNSRHTKSRPSKFLLLALIPLVVVWRRLSADSLNGDAVLQVDGSNQFVASNHANLSSVGPVHTESFAVASGNITIVSRVEAKCRNNAVVILAQKKHSTYDRDSYGLLIKSLGLLAENYVTFNDHAENMDVFLFHTGDFDHRDLDIMEPLLGARKGILKLVNLTGSAYWKLPSWHAKDNQSHWALSDVFPVGYRHMCRWFGVKIWDFFEQLNHQLGCSYRHLLRIDEDSFILSPIHYDIFDYMKDSDFAYGYRMCAYEMDYNRHIAPWFSKWKRKTPMKREITRDLCGFYNNFFVADLLFFQSAPVRKYLKALDRQGFIYRKRYGDLMIHSTAVYAFADPERIHRFLDFTYQHVTTDHILHPEQGCVVWGGIQAGYQDPNAERTLGSFYKEYVLNKKCTANTTYMQEQDLSPTYQHLTDEWKGRVKLKTIIAGKVELPSQGRLSG
jgi:hypothetical protein